MAAGAPFIRLKLNTDQPIDLGEFVSAFTAIGAEYDRYVRAHHPDMLPDATLYIKEVRAGCIEADLIDQVWRKYGPKSGLALSALTHAQGSPWDVTYRKFGQNSVIPKNLIREYYAKKAA